ncbi:MAG: response regulator transcription factor [Thermodesulfobacteriota bacterium]
MTSTAPGPGPTPSVQARPNLLVVEDDPQVSDIYKVFLQGAGFKVSLAGDGQQALRLYQQALEASRPYDLVMMDLHLPVMDGLTCLRRLSSLDRDVRVLITTGSPCDDFGEASDRVAGVVVKPVGLKVLLGKIQAALALPPVRA